MNKLGILIIAGVALSACAPKIALQVEEPKKPIETKHKIDMQTIIETPQYAHAGDLKALELRVSALERLYYRLDKNNALLKQRLEMLKDDLASMGESGKTQKVSQNEQPKPIKEEPATLTEKEQFDRAFILAKEKHDFQKAILEFNTYLTEHPEGEYVNQAHFQLGELYYTTGAIDLAIKEYKSVKNLPGSESIHAAALKRLIEIYTAQKEEDKVRKYSNMLKRTHPNAIF